jgi:hypothetical protein
MKCLEFLYFYLLPEDTTPVGASAKSSSTSTILDHLSRAPPSSPTKRTPPQTLSHLVSDDSSDDEHYAPNPKVHELRMLKNELDFVPSTPNKKSQVNQLGMGSPMKVRGPSSPRTPSKRKRGDLETNSITSSNSSDLPIIREPVPELRTPQREHRRGQSEATLFSMRDSSHSSLDLMSEKTPSKHGRLKLNTPIKRSKTEESVDPGWVRTPGRLHTRGSSMADATLIGNPMEGLVDNSAWPKANEDLLSKGIVGKGFSGNRVRSTAEKTALLGNYLGNVGALVEGMKNVGAWGL